MPVKKIWILISVFLGFNVPMLAQSTTAIIVAHDGKPLPFATITNMRTGKGMFAAENGQVNLGSPFFEAGDTVKISYTGYFDTLVKLPILQNQIMLQYQAVTLQEVEVFPCANSSNVVVKNYKKHTSNYSFSRGSGLSGSWAAYVPNVEQVKGYIETITIEQSFFTVPANARKAPFKIRLLQYDSIRGLPGSPIIAREWMIYPKSNKTVLDISEENIRLPKHGIVVCIDYFYAGEQYSYKQKVLQTYSDGSKKNEWQTNYGAGFRAVKNDNLLGAGFMGGKSQEWVAFKSFGLTPAAVMVKLGVRQCN